MIRKATPALPTTLPVEVPIPAPVGGWVYGGPGVGLSARTFARPDALEPGAVLCDVVLSAICGSDLHTLDGRRQEPTPLILGHEIVGRVAKIGPGGAKDWDGELLSVGDLVTWSIIVACGECFFCHRNLPQKCEQLHKYGHCSCATGQPLTGGFADCIYLKPGTDIFRLPEGVSPEMAVPANCSLATVVNAMEASGLVAGDTALIQGAGLLGVYLTALCKQAGARKVIVADVNAARLRIAEQFGADCCVDLSLSTEDDLADLVAAYTRGRGVDVAFEVCGTDSVFDAGLRCLRTGGRYLVAGVVTSAAQVCIPGQSLTKRCLTFIGIHNYRAEHLAWGLAFLEQNASRLPLHLIVGQTFDLNELDQALDAARTGRSLRVAVRPQPRAKAGRD